jgi:transcriptional regulator with XRE-family HTH domain
VQNLIGGNKPSINKTTPEVQIKYRVFDESEKMPALVYGLDTQGRGLYHAVDSISTHGISDSTVTLNRYDQKAWGMYMVMSKNWNFLGNLGLHAGISKNLSENDDGDEDINVFFGIDKELNRSFSFLLEYDAALNDNLDEGDYALNDITFGKGKGYLNAGIRWAMSPNLMLEINFNDINQNTNSEYTNREIKVMYSESF